MVAELPLPFVDLLLDPLLLDYILEGYCGIVFGVLHPGRAAELHCAPAPAQSSDPGAASRAALCSRPRRPGPAANSQEGRAAELHCAPACGRAINIWVYVAAFVSSRGVSR